MKKFLFILMTAVISSVVIGCANDSDSSNNSTPNNIISGTGSYSDIAAQFLPTDYPALNLPNDIQYTQTTTVDSRYLELVTKLQQTYINALLEALQTYYNTTLNASDTKWHAENNEHSVDITYDSTTEDLQFNFTFKSETTGETPAPTGSLKVKDYIAIEEYGTITSNTTYTLIMLSIDGKVYVKGENNNGEVGNGIKCDDIDGTFDNSDCREKYLNSITEVSKINEKVIQIFNSENIDKALFAVSETGKLYSWGNGNHTPTPLTTISGKIIEFINFNESGTNSIEYLRTDANKLYKLEYNSDSYTWTADEIVIPNENIIQVNIGEYKEGYSSYDTLYIMTESGKCYFIKNITNSETSNTEEQIEMINGITEKIKYAFHSNKYNSEDLHMVITENDKIYGWGRDFYSEILEEYTYGVDTNIPKLLDWDISTNGMITQIFIYNDIYTVTDKGLLYKFGYNAGIVPDINNIKEVQTIASKPYSHITTFLITSDGSAYTLNYNGIKQIDGLKNIKKFYTTYHSSYDTNIYAITEDGDIYSYGRNYDGILGVGNTDALYTTNIAEKVNISEPVEEIYTHINNTTYAIYAVTSNGNVYAWGNNQGDVYRAKIGILGIGNTTDRYIPAPTKVNISNVTSITNIINDYMEDVSKAYALTKDNKLYHWGYDQKSIGGWSPDLITTPKLIDFPKQ